MLSLRGGGDPAAGHGTAARLQGLSQAEVNVALDRALHAAADGVRGKVRQRQIIGRDTPYLAHLIRRVPAAAQPAATAPVTHLPSRAALGLAALIAWLVTVGLGLSMMARWFTRPGRPGLVIAAHIGVACVTILLAILAAIGSG